VTSKGGTTYAAITSMEQDNLKKRVHARAACRQAPGT
jgi:pyrroline-5-carboxylate reductase